MDRDEMSNLYRGPSMLPFIWPSGFGGKDFFKLANQKQELPVVTMFVMDRDKYEQSLERTYQVSVHLAVRIQRRRLKCEKTTDAK